MTLGYNQRWSESNFVPNLNNVNNRKLYLTDITHEYSQRRLESIYMCQISCLQPRFLVGSILIRDICSLTKTSH